MAALGYGYWEVAIEKHGRMKLPTALLKILPENERKKFWITHGFGECIMLWTENAYLEKLEHLNTLNANIVKVRTYRNAFLRNTTNVECDAQGRFVIPKPFIEQYNIANEVTLLMDGGKIEIWDTAKYNAKFSMSPAELEELNQEIYTGHYLNESSQKDESVS